MHAAGWASDTSSWKGNQWGSPYAIATLNLQSYWEYITYKNSNNGSGANNGDNISSRFQFLNNRRILDYSVSGFSSLITNRFPHVDSPRVRRYLRDNSEYFVRYNHREISNSSTSALSQGELVRNLDRYNVMRGYGKRYQSTSLHSENSTLEVSKHYSSSNVSHSIFFLC
jgi:hypothetical protein